MPTVKQILELAKSQVGTTEYPPNSNNVVYNTDYYKRQVSGSDYPWCAVFVWWCFDQFSPCLVKKTASCMNMAQWFKDNGLWIEPGEQQAGDVVFYKFSTNNRWTNHIGIVGEVRGKNDIMAYEGNTSEGNNCNGGAVMYRHRTSNIVGYGRPKYEQAVKPAPKKAKYGLDVSACQASVDFEKVKKAGYEFVILRSTTKNGKPDVKFEKYWDGATQAGMRIAGVYKLCYAHSTTEAQREAEGVINLLKGRKCDIWLDMENYGGQQVYSKEVIALIITSFLTTCVNAGYDVGIYCNLDWYKNHITDDIKKICRFWIARYPKDDNGTVHENLRPDMKGAVMWQFSSKGQVDGIPGNVDLDVTL